MKGRTDMSLRQRGVDSGAQRRKTREDGGAVVR
jgi:hypothetical protein